MVIRFNACPLIGTCREQLGWTEADRGPFISPFPEPPCICRPVPGGAGSGGSGFGSSARRGSKRCGMFCLKGERGRAPRSFPAGLYLGWRRGAEMLAFGRGEEKKKKLIRLFSALARRTRMYCSFCEQGAGRAARGDAAVPADKRTGVWRSGGSAPGGLRARESRERGCWRASGNGGVLGQGGKEGGSEGFNWHS